MPGELQGMPKKLQELIKKYEASGRCFFHYPIKKKVSLSGKRAVSYAKAQSELQELFKEPNENSNENSQAAS